MSVSTRAGRGRPPSTSRDAVSRAALELFARNGFEQTSVAHVADELGVARRTLFRYFDSKNDMVWGDFDWVLDRLRGALETTPASTPMMQAIQDAVIRSNHYAGASLEELRLRMRLITSVPALQAHSMVRYSAWRAVIADFAADRLGQESDDLLPLAIGHLALGASMAAFARWVEHPDEDLEEHLRRGYERLQLAFAGDEPPRPG